MYISLIGLAGSGKTTLFQALTANTADRSPGNATIVCIDVPDERLIYLSGVFKPRKTVYARIEVTDTTAVAEGNLRNESLPAKTIHQLRESDAFLVVLRAFDNGLPPDPIGELRTIGTEFILADMQQVETRLERIEKQAGRRENPLLQQEKTLLEECLSHLGDGKPLSSLTALREKEGMLRGFRFLSQKPLMVLLNLDETPLADTTETMEALEKMVPDGAPVVACSARIEEELTAMESDERLLFMAEYGIQKSIRDRIIQLACETLGIISFLTVGEDECRAWPIRVGITAQEAAGTIHSDLSSKFIRAETVSYEEFARLGSMSECKKAGVWRLEGKDYVVRDGDILSIRAGN